MKFAFKIGIFALALSMFSNADAATISTSVIVGPPNSGGCGSAPGESVSNSNGGSGASYISATDTCSTMSSGAAGAGFAASSSQAAASALGNDFGAGTVGGVASFTVSGLRFELKDGVDVVGLPTTVDFTLNASFDGHLSASSSGGQAGATASAGYRITFSNSSVSEISQGAYQVFTNDNTLNVDTNVTLRKTVLWSRPFSIQMSVNTLAGVNNVNKGNTATALSDFSSTLSFATDRPVFDLPDFLTINAPEVNIFDNRWIDPRGTNPDANVVPLPAGLPLLLAGLGVLSLLRRKQSR